MGVKSVLRKEKYECSLLCADKQPSAGRSRLGSRGSALQLPRWGGGPGRSPRVPSRQQHQHSGGAGGGCPRPTPARSSPESAQHQLWPSKVSRMRHRRGPEPVRKETPRQGARPARHPGLGVTTVPGRIREPEAGAAGHNGTGPGPEHDLSRDWASLFTQGCIASSFTRKFRRSQVTLHGTSVAVGHPPLEPP